MTHPNFVKLTIKPTKGPEQAVWINTMRVSRIYTSTDPDCCYIYLSLDNSEETMRIKGSPEEISQRLSGNVR